jgi:hypothetical protein
VKINSNYSKKKTSPQSGHVTREACQHLIIKEIKWMAFSVSGALFDKV